MRHEDWSCRFLEGNRNVCVVSATLVVFGIDRQGKIDAVHTIVLVDDQGRVEKELKEHSMHASSSERTTST